MIIGSVISGGYDAEGFFSEIIWMVTPAPTAMTIAVTSRFPEKKNRVIIIAPQRKRRLNAMALLLTPSPRS